MWAGRPASGLGTEAPVDNPVSEQVFFDADRVLVSDYRLRFPYRAVSEDRVRFPIRTVEMFRIRSAAVDEARMASETGLNHFLKIAGGIIKWPAVLGAFGISIISLWRILFLVLDHYGITQPSKFNPPYSGGSPVFPAVNAFLDALGEKHKGLREAYPVEYWTAIVLILVGLGVVAWMGDKVTDLRPVRATRYRVGLEVVDRRGESERLYFGEYEEPTEAERIVSAIEYAKVAIAARESAPG